MKDNPFNLEKKTLLITGASSGIGRSIAIESSKLGAKTVLVDLNQQGLNETFSFLHGYEHSVKCCNLTNDDEINYLAESVPALDGIVHCAGVGLTLPFKFITKGELNRVMDINFQAPVLLTQRLLRKKKINRNGSIIYLSSIDGVITGHIGNSIYAASKGALSGIAKTQAVELAPLQIRVNCILPGRVETPLLNRDNISEEQIIKNKDSYPLKRYARPEEIAYYAIYLFSDASTFTTGSSLVIDGGFTLL